MSNPEDFGEASGDDILEQSYFEPENLPQADESPGLSPSPSPGTVFDRNHNADIEMERANGDAESEPGEAFDDDDDVCPDLSVEPRIISEMTDHLQKKIFANFKHFLKNFTTPKEPTKFRYVDLIRNMAREYKHSLIVNFSDIFKATTTLGAWLHESPALILPILNSVVFSLIQERYPTWANNVHDGVVRVSIAGYPPNDNLNGLRASHLNKLIGFDGVVSKRGIVLNEVVAMYIDCERCGFTTGPIEVNEDKEVKPKCCAQCQSRGPFVINRSKTKYRDYQRIVVQERPGTLVGGRAPQSKECILTAEQVDTVRPGDDVHITGIYVCNYDSLQNAQTKFPVFRTRVLVNHLKRSEDETNFEFSEKETELILELSRDPNIRERIVHSIAPSIFGETAVKEAIALSMFGGRMKVSQGSHRMRGDINVLILGDPGMAKSQILKYVERTFHRAVYTTGKGASAVGLTAGVVRDHSTGEWTLEGGAMVLADSGICLIDEFDKMNDQDRTSIHEAMEQQTISVCKAGIVASLQARCAVIAAANPIKGVYDATVDFHENVNLTDPILSRFDILIVLRNEVDRVSDERLADFVMCQHRKGHPYITEVDAEKIIPKYKLRSHVDLIPQELLGKYILYTRQKVFPDIRGIDKEKIARFYERVREECFARGGMQMTVRHVESMVRMAEANARMELRENVTKKDADYAIATMLECFCQSQKHQLAEELRQKFRHFIECVVDQRDLLMMKLRRLFQEEERAIRFRAGDNILDNAEVEVSAFLRHAKDLEVANASTFFESDRFRAEFYLQADRILRK